jgi:hypothetical protein
MQSWDSRRNGSDRPEHVLLMNRFLAALMYGIVFLAQAETV